MKKTLILAVLQLTLGYPLMSDYSVICKNTPCTITTRQAVSGDEKILYELISELAEFEKNTASLQSLTVENLLRFGFGKNPYFFVELAEVDGRCSGYALYYYGFSANLGRPILFLEDLYVKPEYRRKKIATTLIKKLVQYAQERECIRLEWVVFSWNKEARAFYERLGASVKEDFVHMRLNERSLADLHT